MGGGGICQALRATDHKNPPKVVVEIKHEQDQSDG